MIAHLAPTRAATCIWSTPVVPRPLLDNVERHCRNLCDLVASLRDAGVDEAAINASLDAMIASYRAELAATFEILMGVRTHA